MKVLEFAFGSRELGSAYLPHCYPTNCVVYTGTHDNDTIRGWMASAPRKEAAFAKEYLRLSRGEGYHWGMMRAAWASPAGSGRGPDAGPAGPGLRGPNEHSLHPGR